MPIPKSLQNFLEKNKIKFKEINHKTVYTAFDKATTLRLKPQNVTKTIIVSLDGKDHALAIIPANKNLDKKKLLKIINAGRKKQSQKLFKKIDFAKEVWMKNNLKSIKVGSTPPFGLLYKLPTFIDNALAKQTKLIVGAGNYETSLEISPSALLKSDSTIIKGSFSQNKK
ncbi:MAG: YbaK/EbsC family protein [Candidatus Portnoybacteria bacterium]|nr:YbaK/EbsC family protein [Candidatus Portnoybacteria bacterium]